MHSSLALKARSQHKFALVTSLHIGIIKCDKHRCLFYDSRVYCFKFSFILFYFVEGLMSFRSCLFRGRGGCVCLCEFLYFMFYYYYYFIIVCLFCVCVLFSLVGC